MQAHYLKSSTDFHFSQGTVLTPSGEDYNYVLKFRDPGGINMYEYLSFFNNTDPLQWVHSGVLLATLKVFGEEAVGDGGEFLIAGISLAFIPGIANLGDAEPLLLRHL